MNERGKTVDKTYLSIDNAEKRGFLHRDYIAHCLRWSYASKRLGAAGVRGKARVLDIGCGRELPLAKLLYSSRFFPAQYYGVDVGPIPDETFSFFNPSLPMQVWEKTDVVSLGLSDLADKPVDWITCFEVLEHVEPKHMHQILDKMSELITPEGNILISTPCWDRKSCAANHVNEMTFEALGALLEDRFKIDAVYGTFASISDYKEVMDQEFEELPFIFDCLRDYHDTNVLANIFAPLFPARSRNCLWHLRPETSKGPQKFGGRFGPIEECKTPWGSSKLWQDMR